MVGLGKVDNTSDANKPISSATQNALDTKADKTITYTKNVDRHFSHLIASAPDALNTLNEQTQAQANNQSYATTVVNQLAQTDDESTTYAKTEVVDALSAKANLSTAYTKEYVDNALSAKANQLTTDTKRAVNDALSAKANQSTTYTQTEGNDALSAKQPSILSTTSLSLNSITTSGTVTANQIKSRYHKSPTWFTDMQLKAR